MTFEILLKKDKILMIDGFVLKSNKREVGFNIVDSSIMAMPKCFRSKS